MNNLRQAAGKQLCFISVMEVQAESDMISNYIEMYHLAPAKRMNHKHWLTVPIDGIISDSKVLDLLDMSYDIVDEQEEMADK
jgi:predicted DNA-binding protein (MmcQ/YjbR family)|nr:MmcQ/YjbR family DNA-binding protein [uncultured Blautia sp.]